MKTAVYALWLVLMPVMNAAQADPSVDDGGGPPASGKPQASQPPSAGDGRRSQKPAGTFTPSEKVGADSAVSFPVDI